MTSRPAASSYLRYLPPVLWDVGRPAGEVSLGDLLLVFEKVLTGVPDDLVLRHGDHVHPSIGGQIEDVPRVFDPWTAPKGFLDWLAAGVALEVPTLRDRPLWNEYQRRTVIARIAGLHPQRGTKRGLSRYLELFSALRTRIAIDDGARLVAIAPTERGTAPTWPVVSQGPVLAGARIVSEGLLRPWCLATTADGGLVVGDIAMPDALRMPFKSRVWLVDPVRGYRTSGAPPGARPLAADTLTLTRVVAVAVRPPGSGTPETLYVLDRDGRLFALAAPFDRAVHLTAGAPGVGDSPVAMAFDPRDGTLLVLTRGAGPGTANPHRIVTVRPEPFAITSRTDLRTVREPLALAVDRDGVLLIGDGREQRPLSDAQRAGNVVRVDRQQTPWAETLLLPADNPLVAPTAFARTRDGRLYVLDAGLKPFSPPTTFPFISAVARPAAVFHVMPGDPAGAVRVSEPGELVYPTGMVAVGGHLLVADPGQPPNGWSLGNNDLKGSRALPFQFDVVVHFAADRMSTDDAERRATVRAVLSTVRAVAEWERPAHVRCNVISGS